MCGECLNVAAGLHFILSSAHKESTGTTNSHGKYIFILPGFDSFMLRRQ